MSSKILSNAIELNKIVFDESNNRLNFAVDVYSNNAPIADVTAGLYANSAFAQANTAFEAANNINIYDANTVSTGFFAIPKGTSAQRPSDPAFGSFRFNTDTNSLEIYNPTGWLPLAAPPTITTVSPSTFSGDSGTQFTINGTNFTSDAQVYFVTSNTTALLASTVTFVGGNQLLATTPRNIIVEEEPISVRVVQSSGTVNKLDVIDAGGLPVWVTSSGTLGSVFGANVINVYVSATDPEETAITYEIESGSLPTGTQLSANGLIQGIADPVTANVTYNFTIKASDTVSNNTDRTFSYTVLNRSPIINTESGLIETIISGNSVPITTIDAYDPDGGTITFTVTSGNIVNSTVGSANGNIVGTPIVVTSNTTYDIGITVTDEGSLTASNTYSFIVLNRFPVINTESALLQTFVSGNSIPSTLIDAYDPDGSSLTFSISSGNLINTSIGSSNGIISGTPINLTSNNQYFTFDVSVTDNGTDFTTRNYSIRVLPKALTSTLSQASYSLLVGTSYNFRPVNPVDGLSPYTYAISPSILSGLSFNTSTGYITGSPSSSGSGSYTVTITDLANQTSSQSFSVSATLPPITLTSSTADVGTASRIFTLNQQIWPYTPISASGGVGSLTYSISPSLPSGLSFNTSTGQITGTPTATRTAATHTVTVTDSASQTNSATFTLGVSTISRTWRYWVWSIKESEGGGLTQASEFRFQNNGSDQSMVSTVTSDGGAGGPSEAVDKLIDGDLNTKFFAGLPVYAKFDFGSNRTFNGYRWATANDDYGRDPKTWLIYGSSDGVTFQQLELRSNFTDSPNRQTFTSGFTF